MDRVWSLIPLRRTSQSSAPPTPPQLPPALPPTLPRQSISIQEWKHGVFVSYRGKDTKAEFVSKLFREMDDRGIRYFKDSDRENRGQDINWMLQDGIHHSRVALIVLSPNYADSKWCLNELEEIFRCNDLHKPVHIVQPIFLDVLTSDVRRLEGKFGEGFKRGVATNKDKADKWKAALTRVGNLAGWNLKNDTNGDETKLIELIVGQLYDQFFYVQSLFIVKDVVEMKDDVEQVISLLNVNEQKDVKLVGVYGIRGVGKTTMAKIICSRIAAKFVRSSFLENVQDAKEEGLVNKLLHDIRMKQRPTTYDLHSILEEIRSNLRQKRLLLVLDNVDHRDRVDLLLGDRKWLSAGSRILITTRYEYLLNELEVDHKYMVSGLGQEESLQLFHRHAFSADHPKEGYGELSKNFVHYAGGHPLALTKLGCFLHKKTEDQWCTILKKLATHPHLDSVGIHLEPVPIAYPVKLGPCGGSLGSQSYDDKTYTGIRQITVTVASGIQSIMVDYDQYGCLIRSTAYGKPDGGANFTIKLDYPNEYLTSISGYVRKDCDSVAVQSLSFHSNMRTYGPFGEKGETRFTCQQNGGKITGLHGTYGRFLSSIGAYLAPVSRPYPFTSVGPYGGKGEKAWNDGKYTDVRQINIVVNSSIIKSISILYDDNGYPTSRYIDRKSDDNGCPTIPDINRKSDRGQTCSVKLDYPYEYITSISGFAKGDQERVIISSLTIQSNLRSYGPFGTEDGDPFSFPRNGGKVVGFFGRASGHLESIGAYFEPISHTHPFKSFGPFGGECGSPWDDGINTSIRQIFLTYGSVIDSINCGYDSDGDILETSHGGSGTITYQIALDYPSEYLTSISGHTAEYDGSTVVTSLMFHSNIRMYGPFGNEEGTYFSTPSNSGKIVGFHGRSDNHLNSIGAHLEVYSNKLYPFKSVGPFGLSGTSHWDDGRFSHVIQIDIVVESTIRSIRFNYKKDKSFSRSQFHGASNNVHGDMYMIKLEFQEEYLIAISGYIGDDIGSDSIRSLKFQSNKRTYGPFGTETGKYFSTPATGGKIVGFFGTSDSSHLVSIGAHFEPISHLYPVQSIGHFGAQGRSFWSDGMFTGVKGIKILFDNWIIRIFVEYDKNSGPVWPSAYANSSGRSTETIKLDSPNEYLTSISGYVNDECGSVVIQSLTFQSNKRRYGPYGKEKGSYFWYPPTGSKIVGFFLSYGTDHLSSIGVYTVPLPHWQPFKSVGPYGGQGGNQWDDGVYTDVRQIKILHGCVIVSIGIEYDNNGSPIPCSHHGNDRFYMGTEVEAQGIRAKRERLFFMPEPKKISVKLDYPKEYLVSVSGFTGTEFYEEVIQSLTIKTNKRTYGPYGTEEGKPFELLPPDGGRIIGFYGRSGRFLNSIGARLEPL